MERTKEGDDSCKEEKTAVTSGKVREVVRVAR